jgi:hypothetical protein
LGEETGRHSYLIHEHSASIQVFEILNFEFKSKLRMLQPDCAQAARRNPCGMPRSVAPNRSLESLRSRRNPHPSQHRRPSPAGAVAPRALVMVRAAAAAGSSAPGWVGGTRPNGPRVRRNGPTVQLGFLSVYFVFYTYTYTYTCLFCFYTYT